MENHQKVDEIIFDQASLQVVIIFFQKQWSLSL